MAEPLPPLGEVIRRHGLAARRSLGQNFLLDLNLTGRIARAANPEDGNDILEIGPGPGGLTRALIAAGARRIVVVERDRRCIAALEEIAASAPGRLEIIEADALSIDHAALVHPPARICANLPYNIATPLLLGWLAAEPWPPWWDRVVAMFQKEVAERIVAQPATRAYGRLAVAAQWRARARILFTVDRRAFTPPPKVTSAVVEIRPSAEPADAPGRQTLERVAAAAFGQRRKMLRTSLKAVTTDPAGLCQAAGLAATLRAEDVGIAGFVQLARLVEGATSP